MMRTVPGISIPRWLPNALTILRIALIPAFVMHGHWCIASVAEGASDEPHRALAGAALLGIGISDILDGWLARRWGLVTRLGATLDALADKLAQIGLLAFFATADNVAFARVPLWFVAVVIGRDVVLAAGTMAVRWHRGRVEVVHESHGRATSLLLFVLLLWLTADLPRAVLPATLALLTVITVLSAAGYVRDGWRQWNADPATVAPQTQLPVGRARRDSLQRKQRER